MVKKPFYPVLFPKKNDPDHLIIVLATAESKHKYLVQALEVLQVADLKNISIISTD